MDINFLQQNSAVLVLIIVWEIIWKGIALWRAGRRNQKYWFVALLIINSAGILPIIFLLITKKKKAGD